MKWINVEKSNPANIETLNHCDIFNSKNRFILQIIITITITSATAERSYFSLQQLKNYMTFTMFEERMNELAIINIHKKANIYTNEFNQ